MKPEHEAEALAEFAVVEATVAEQARIREHQHNQTVTWLYPTKDWRGVDDLY